MHQDRTPLPLRNDTLLGVCEALGQDFGVNPQLLRIAFALAMVWQPLAVVGAYLTAGVLVLLSRLIVPVKRAAQPAAPTATLPAQEAAAAVEDAPELAKAA